MIFVCYSIVGVSQQLPKTIHLDIDNGLKQNTVFAIEEDHYGRIWIGTSAGLQYYTGYDLVDFDEVEEKIMLLHKTDSALYCITFTGVYRIDFGTLKTSKYVFYKSGYFTPIFQDNEIIFNNHTDETSFLIDYQMKFISDREYDAVIPEFFYEFPFGGYVFKSDKKGVYYYDSDTVFVARSRSTHYEIVDENKVFIASFEGVVSLTLNEGRIEREVYFPKLRIENFLLDKNDNLWVGSSEDGLFMLHKNVLNSEFYPINYDDGKPVPCWGIFTIKDKLYVSTTNGITRLDNNSEKDYYEKSVGDLACFTGCAVDDVVLIGSGQYGVFKIEKGKLKQIYYKKDDRLDCIVMQIIENDQGFLATTKRSFVQFDHQGEYLYAKKYDFSILDNYVMHIRKLENGYMVSTTDGIFELDDNFTILNTYKSVKGRVFSMSTSFQDNIWSVSSDNGLFQISNDMLHAIFTPDQQFFSIANVGDSVLCLGGYSEVCIYSEKQYRSYEFENGFPIKEYNQNCFYQSDYLFYGGIGGVFKIHPDSIQDFPEFPSVLVKRNDEYVDIGKNILLNYDQSELAFTLIPVMQSDKNLFKIEYKLNGTWQVLSETCQVVETVMWGKNSLQIRIKNTVTGEEKNTKVVINRSQPFWTKLWFKLVLGCLFVLLSFGIYSFIKFRQTKKLLHKEQAQKKITEERLRISNELHDNIGARLTHIISSLDIEMFQRKENNKSIEVINSFARETMSQLRETIWAVGDKTIYFSEFINRVSQYVEQVNGMTNISIMFTQESIQDFELNPVQTINYYRIIQEAINNSIKYAEASAIKVKAVNRKSGTEITITDNGVGFDTDKKRRGTGLNGMESRAKEAGGVIEISSQSVEGTSIKLIIPQ